MDRLGGKVALVTGAGRGIGQAIALRFAHEGAKVAAVDIRGELAEQTARRIAQQGGEGLPLQADVAVNDEVNGFVTKTVDAFGGINILVNNAGMGGSKACLDTSEGDWDRMVAVNLKSIYLVCKRVIPEMLRLGKGKIINIASMYGMFGSPDTAAYSASKAGVINLTRQLAVDYSSYNICINAISPGLIETEMTRRKVRDLRVLTKYLRSIPLGRHGTPDDVAGAAVFLASDDSDFITGHNLVVDGGQSCRIT